MRRFFSLLLLCLATPLWAGDALFIENLTWPEVRAAIASGKTTAIFYAGSTEQNGPHMVLGKHNVVAHHVAARIAQELGNALIYPILPFAPTGDTETRAEHMAFPGSVSLSPSHYGAVARDVALSAIAAGFKTVALMGDHGGGQESLARVAQDLDSIWRPKGVRVFHVPDLYFESDRQAQAYLRSLGLQGGGHADVQDTSELMALDPKGEWIRKPMLAPGAPGTGVEGDPRPASAAIGRHLIDLKVRSAVTQIRRLSTP